MYLHVLPVGTARVATPAQVSHQGKKDVHQGSCICQANDQMQFKKTS